MKKVLSLLILAVCVLQGCSSTMYVRSDIPVLGPVLVEKIATVNSEVFCKEARQEVRSAKVHMRYNKFRAEARSRCSW
jgi:hypothetical protein